MSYYYGSVVLIGLLLCLTGCDVEETINVYFRQMGLTRLAVIEAIFNPGDLF